MTKQNKQQASGKGFGKKVEDREIVFTDADLDAVTAISFGHWFEAYFDMPEGEGLKLANRGFFMHYPGSPDPNGYYEMVTKVESRSVESHERMLDWVAAIVNRYRELGAINIDISYDRDLDTFKIEFLTKGDRILLENFKFRATYSR